MPKVLKLTNTNDTFRQERSIFLLWDESRRDDPNDHLAVDLNPERLFPAQTAEFRDVQALQFVSGLQTRLEADGVTFDDLEDDGVVYGYTAPAAVIRNPNDHAVTIGFGDDLHLTLSPGSVAYVKPTAVADDEWTLIEKRANPQATEHPAFAGWWRGVEVEVITV